MKDLFTIVINTRIFVPIIRENVAYYYIDYVGHSQPFRKGYSVLKSDVTDIKSLKAIKRLIKQDIYELLYK